jgi:hypothetical protein
MPRLLTGLTLVRFNLLQGVKARRHEGFFNYLIFLGKIDFQECFSGALAPQTFV